MRFLSVAVAAAVLVAGCLSGAGAQTTGAPSGGAVGAPQGVPGSVGNSSPGFGRSSTGGSAGASRAQQSGGSRREYSWRVGWRGNRADGADKI